MDERAQTQVDFAVGVGVFLLVLAGVLLFLPDVFAAYEDPVGPAVEEEADRVAATLVEDHRVAGTERTLAFDGLNATLTDANVSAVRDAAGVPDHRALNVTVVDGSPDGATVASVGPSYDDQTAATTVRVADSTDDGVCDPVCRIVVRAW
jgi:hypothetical protein